MINDFAKSKLALRDMCVRVWEKELWDEYVNRLSICHRHSNTMSTAKARICFFVCDPSLRFIGWYSNFLCLLTFFITAKLPSKLIENRHEFSAGILRSSFVFASLLHSLLRYHFIESNLFLLPLGDGAKWHLNQFKIEVNGDGTSANQMTFSNRVKRNPSG